MRPIPVNTPGGMTESLALYGEPVWAGRDADQVAEAVAAAQVRATISATFVLRASAFTRGISAKDVVRSEGQDFDIIGVRPRGVAFLEIAAVARADT